ncbi:MAG: hypothetical protein IJ716_10905 [Lachnospiraceae bacterium]|nr:hypothetical protein [Lachnospiraceae bacterium]
MAEKRKTIHMKQDRFVRKSLFSEKTIMAEQLASIYIDCGDGMTSEETYDFHMKTGEKIHFTRGDMTEDSVPVIKFAYRSNVSYQYSKLGSLTYTNSFEAVKERIDLVMAQYMEYGQTLVQSKFGADCRFVIEPKFKDYFWQISYYLEKNGQKAGELGTMSLCYLSKFDPDSGEHEYAMTAELSDEEEGKEIIKDDIDDFA